MPIALLGRLRMLLAEEQRGSRLQSHVHLKLEEDLRDLNILLADNQRLFHSPIPPSMSRHVSRCLMIWLSALPVVLCKSMPPVGVAIACAITAFIYLGMLCRCSLSLAGCASAVPLSLPLSLFHLGMEEIGAQVEQPFGASPGL